MTELGSVSHHDFRTAITTTYAVTGRAWSTKQLAVLDVLRPAELLLEVADLGELRQLGPRSSVCAAPRSAGGGSSRVPPSGSRTTAWGCVVRRDF
jgi:hypothetical protein